MAATLQGMQRDRAEVYPGRAGVIRFASRLASGLLLKHLSQVFTRRPEAARR